MGESLSQNQMQLGEQIVHETWRVIILLPLPSARYFAPEELGPPWGAALEERCREQKEGAGWEAEVSGSRLANAVPARKGV